MFKITFNFEMDEEQLRDIFENHDIKFSKKKVKEIKQDMEFNFDTVMLEMEEKFSEVFEEWLDNMDWE